MQTLDETVNNQIRFPMGAPGTFIDWIPSPLLVLHSTPEFIQGVAGSRPAWLSYDIMSLLTFTDIFNQNDLT